jgi:hypothetical protein
MSAFVCKCKNNTKINAHQIKSISDEIFNEKVVITISGNRYKNNSA